MRGKVSKSAPPRADASAYLILGPDRFRAVEAVRSVIEAVVGTEPDPTTVSEYDSDDTELAAVLDDLRTPSLLAPRRVVALRNADEFVSRYRDALEAYLESPADCSVFILQVRTCASNTRLYKRFEQAGRIIECDVLRPNELRGWIANRADSVYGCRVAPDGVARLLELVEPDSGRIDSELAKLATFIVPRTTITREDVELLVGSNRQEKLFAITDAIARGDARTALSIWHQILATERDAPYRAIGGLAWSFRRSVEIARLLAVGESPAAIRQRLRIPPFAPDPDAQVGRLSLRHWEHYLVKLLQADIAGKTGLSTTEVGVERLIVEMCADATGGAGRKSRQVPVAAGGSV